MRQTCLLGNYFRKRDRAASLAALVHSAPPWVYFWLSRPRMVFLTVIVISALRSGPSDQIETNTNHSAPWSFIQILKPQQLKTLNSASQSESSGIAVLRVSVFETYCKTLGLVEGMKRF